MIEILEKHRCCGCAACYSVCAHKAISMQLDEEGFEYPVVNQDICVDCRFCQNVCPVIQYENKTDIRKSNNNALMGFAARNTNMRQRMESSSGSIFPPIAEWIIEQGGMVVGAAYDSDFNIVHRIVEKKEDITFLQGSKYLQCKADNVTFIKIKQELQKGRKVLYSGMACQVEGLKSFLRKNYENLYTIDLICMGIPSYVVWQKYLKTYFKGEKIKAINFKEKSTGWDTFTFRVDTDKRTFKERGKYNKYLCSMFLSWNMRPSCFNCPFKKIERISDFTLADAWGVSNNVPEINDNKGLSSVIVHSSKGLALWKQLKDKTESIKVSIEEIAKGNSNLVSNKPQAGNRALFYKTLSTDPEKAFGKLCVVRKETITNRMRHRIIKLLKKIIIWS